MNQNNQLKVISQSSLKGLPFYLNHLKKENLLKHEFISAAQIAKDLNLSEIQVKKDLASVASFKGKPNVGHKVVNLINDIETFLGYRNTTNAVLVGVGHLGKALLNYQGFEEYGLKIIFGVDNNTNLIGKIINGVEVITMDKLIALCPRMHINIGIITIGKEDAQDVCNTLVKAGIKAIWNFAPVKLVVDDSVIVQNENMASSLAVLSRHLMRKIGKEE